MSHASESIQLSIGVPTYNRAALLKNMLPELCRETARHPLANAIEICVSDNGSSDDTPQVIDQCRHSFAGLNFRHERQTHNLGFSGNFLAVVRTATGTGFVILADDDSLVPQALDHLLSAVDQLSAETPLVLFNTLPGGDAIDRRLVLPTDEMMIAGPDELLGRLGIFHASFVSNLLFHRESAVRLWHDDMAKSRYPHMALAMALLATRPGQYRPQALVKVALPPDANDQPLLTCVDMAQLQTTYVLNDPRCRRWIGWVYRYLVRMVPTAVYLHRTGRTIGQPGNPFADLRLSNVRACYRQSYFWQWIATMLWFAASILPVRLLAALLRLVSRHPR